MAQTVLSVRLIPQSIASGDESLYIYSGHQLIYELWHGGGSPYYETFFSGAPDLYPIIAATIDHVGGLAAVRLASLVFMLVSTTLLFATARIIFGYWPAVAAAGLFAGLGITQALGALATYDALALMLTATAAYCAVKAATDDAHSTRWLALVPLALLTANAVKYASGLFDPVVLGLAALLISHQGWKRAAQRFAVLSLATVLLIILAVYLGGTARVPARSAICLAVGWLIRVHAGHPELAGVGAAEWPSRGEGIVAFRSRRGFRLAAPAAW